MNIGLYLVAMTFLLASFYKDKKKTKKALMKALKSIENILPQLLSIILLVGIILSIFDADFISKTIGGDSGWFGILLSSAIGAVTLIPGFIAFPTASLLLESGAGIMQIGAFVSSLMMVGIISAPVEIRYLGKKMTFMRNLLAFLFSFIVAFVIGKVAGGI